MSLFQVYLRKPSTQRILNRRPGERGFSLIELVVVVAVLAILAAIAIPSFTSINDKAKASGAANTIAQIAKECAVKDANNETMQFQIPNLSGYAITPTIQGSTVIGDCTGGNATELVATSDSTGQYPTFVYNVTTGAKTCSHTAGANTALHGCSAGTGGRW